MHRYRYNDTCGFLLIVCGRIHYVQSYRCSESSFCYDFFQDCLEHFKDTLGLDISASSFVSSYRNQKLHTWWSIDIILLCLSHFGD